MFTALLRKAPAPGIFAIGVDREGIAIARVLTRPGQRPALLAGDYCAYGDNSGIAALMQSIAQKYQLQKTYCSSVLEGGDYKLLLTEAPDVPPEELHAALRWRIKDLIDTPVNDITLDVIEAPPTAGAQRSAVYVVAARNEVIWQRVDLLKAAKVNLQIIDIAEMAQRNIAKLLPQDAMGIAALSLRPHHSLITLSRAGELYLSRTLAVGLEAIGDSQQRDSAFNQVALEIQRSLDYYDSHFRQAPIRHLALLPVPREATKLVEYLRQNLSIEVQVVDLNELVDHQIEMTRDLQAKIFLPLGAALREQAAA